MHLPVSTAKHIGISFKYGLIILILSWLFVMSCGPEKQAPVTVSEPPAWASDVIWYQIFVERFRNGDTTNDPTPAQMKNSTDHYTIPAEWRVSPWNGNWNYQESWTRGTGMGFNESLQYRRYGGDLQGVQDKLDYLQDLGVTAIYFNPLNDATSLHKYDARNYHHVDVNFGPDPEGDERIIASENPADPSTWQWTSADKLFLKVVEELHKRNIRVVMDFSWNHTGVEFWAWKDVVKNQSASAYRDWYEVNSFDTPATAKNEFAYSGWANVPSMPELKKVDVREKRISGLPYEGNMRADVKAHIFAISKRWLAPDGDTTNGIDGYRLDVADQIPLGFWREYRTFVKSVKPDAMLIGEIWWESWPHRLMNPAPYCKGDIFDAVMFYQVYRPARYFFAQTNFPIDAKMLQDSLNFQWNRLAEPFRYAQMNVNATHDAPRLLTCFANPNLYKYHANWFADSSYNQGAVTADTRQRVKLYLAHQFTMIGAPAIWNGDEMGMWGGDDPDCRKPLWWPDYTFEPETQRTLFPERSQDQDALSPASTRGNTNSTRLSTIPRPIPPAGVGFDSAHYAYYKKLARVRNENPVLARGKIEFLDGGNRMLVYRRYDGKSEIIALFNVDTQPKQFSLPPGSFEDLLGGQKGLGNTVTVAPMQAMILRKG